MKMRVFPGIAVSMVVASSITVALCRPASSRTITATHPPFPPKGYILAWSDNFNSNGVNTAKWYYRTDSKFLSVQLPHNVSAGHGTLTIAVKHQRINGKNYSGGGLISRRRFKYGYYEAQVRIPAGSGWHTSFWLEKYNPKVGTTEGFRHGLPYQEIDICEIDSASPNVYSDNVHKWPAPGNFALSGSLHAPNLARSFHWFSCLYTPQSAKFYLDGKLMHVTDMRRFPHNTMNIWLTCIAVPGHMNNRKLPGAAEFRLVRYYAPPKTAHGDIPTR